MHLPQVGRWSKGADCGAQNLLKRSAPWPFCELDGVERSQARMRPYVVVIVAPRID